MEAKANPPFLLKEALPEFCEELKGYLRKQLNDAWAEAIDELMVYGRCACSDPNCATVSTDPDPYLAGADPVECIQIEGSGVITLDIRDSKIVLVEIVDRKDVADALDRTLSIYPPNP